MLNIAYCFHVYTDSYLSVFQVFLDMCSNKSRYLHEISLLLIKQCVFTSPGMCWKRICMFIWYMMGFIFDPCDRDRRIFNFRVNCFDPFWCVFCAAAKSQSAKTLIWRPLLTHFSLLKLNNFFKFKTRRIQRFCFWH